MMPWHFANIPGMEAEKALLHKMVQEDHIPHALLFLGDYGAASMGLALAFARLVLCTDPRGGEPCEQCGSCQKSAGWVHPDLHFSYPVIGSNKLSRDFLDPWRQQLKSSPYFTPADWFATQSADSKQGNINVAEVKDILDRLSVTKVEGRYKILILWGAEYLRGEANQLLKFIEEPPDHTLFVLVAEDPGQILPTVLSRCQLIKIRAFNDQEIAEALEARMLADAHESAQLAFLADGSMSEALRLVETTTQPVAELFLSWMRACYQGTGADTLLMVEKLATLHKEEVKTLFQYAMHFIRQMLLAHVGQVRYIRLPEAELKAAVRMATQFDLQRLEELQQLFTISHHGMERNANMRILFMHTSIQIHALFRNKARYTPIINLS